MPFVGRLRLLYVEPAEDEQNLLTFQLDQLGVAVCAVGDVTEAKAALERDDFDALLANESLAGLTALDLIEYTHATDSSLPVLVLATSPTRSRIQQFNDCGCARVLVKPYTFQTLVDALQPYLRRAPEQGTCSDNDTLPLISQYWSELAMRPAVKRYVDHLEAQIAQIDNAFIAGSGISLPRKIVSDIESSAVDYGYSSLGETAGTLYDLLQRDAPEDEISAAWKRLKRLSEAARAGVREGR